MNTANVSVHNTGDLDTNCLKLCKQLTSVGSAQN
jgi:hypothetical protein